MLNMSLYAVLSVQQNGSGVESHLFFPPSFPGGFTETREKARDVSALYVFEASSQSTALSLIKHSEERCECCALVLLQTAGADG